jgi:pimeloyl-ACP methyl ester carboxylesterase
MDRRPYATDAEAQGAPNARGHHAATVSHRDTTGRPGRPARETRPHPTEPEQARLRLYTETSDRSGYSAIQSTRPQTLAYGLHDSPAGQLAWIVEKFKEWTDPAADLPEDAVDRDQLLTNVTVYWLTGTAGSAARLYKDGAMDWSQPLGPSRVPTGVAVFPGDAGIRRVAEQNDNVVHWSEFDRGGHFAAMEAPDLLVTDIRAFFRPLR